MYEAVDRCRSCGFDRLDLVLDLGDQYLSDFRSDESKPPKAPLTLLFCGQCGLVQLAHTVHRDQMYTENYGFRSGVNEGIVADLKSIVDEALTYHQEGNWLDIASNDGTLLSFVPESFHREGIDPVAKFQAEAKVHADTITVDYFSAARVEKLDYDVITSISMFYDIDDLNSFVKEVKSVLASDGVWVVQQNYLLDMVTQGAVDNVCHEHLTYFSLNSLKPLLDRHDLKVVAVSTSGVNGGVIRTVVAHKDSVHLTRRSVREQRDRELELGLPTPGAMTQFADRAASSVESLRALVDDLVDQGKVIDIYGASTRGAVLWQAAGITDEHVRWAVERQPEKVGKWFSPIGVPIVDEDTMREEPPDYLLVGPWWHAKAFLEREKAFLDQGGSFIFPLPEVVVVG